MNLWNQGAFLKALGWSLVDSLWQIGILWVLYVIVTANGKRFLAKQRHSLALMSLAGGSLWFIITLIINFYRSGDQENFIGTTTAFFAAALPGLSNNLEQALPYLSLLYLATIIFLFIRFYCHYRYTQKLTSEGLHKIDPELRIFTREIAERMGIKKEVRIWLSEMVDTPLTLNFWKPVILLPIAVVNHLNISQTEAIILHELNHISRNDYLINLLVACADIILFFNPFARILGNIVKKERENSCDDLVLQFRYDARSYAKALLTLEQNRIGNSYLAVAATGKSKHILLNRVRRILNQQPVIAPLRYRSLGFLLSAFLIGFINWYNPGKAIAEKVNQIVDDNARVVTIEQPLKFTTPTLIEAKEKQKTAKTLVDIAKANKKTDKELREADALRKVLAELALQPGVLSYDDEEESPLVSAFVAANTPREFSIPLTPEASVPFQELQTLPYVPGSSFSYHFVEDTTYPKRYIVSYNDQKAKESHDKALKALEEINWTKMEQELNKNGKKVDILKVKEEMLKALEEVNWEKVNNDFNASLSITEADIAKQNEIFSGQLQRFNQNRIATSDKQKKTQLTIVQDRLKECGAIQKIEENKKKKESTNTTSTNTQQTIKVKKIVVI
jgi:beta-lactamase regulating signal transducer with metallopeptidase domain